MSLVSEFKEFALKGNMVDLAVGVVIGAAFGKIVSSLVTDIIMPPLGLITGGVDFSKKVIVLKAGPPPVELAYGKFINATIDFLIVALAIFAVIKLINAARRKRPEPPAAPPAPPREEVLLTEIRDILKSKPTA